MTNQTQKGETMTTQSKTATWIVEYSDHDCGSKGGHFLRKTEARAKRSAELMKGCGYRETTYRQWTR